MENRFRMYCIVFCIAWATLVLELLQTRILSVLYFNNVVYLTVTVVLMGFGISGVFVSIFSRRLKSPEKVASFCIGMFALTCFVCLRIASFFPVVAPQSGTFFKLILAYGLLIIPFIFAGCSLGIIFMTHGRDIYRLYFVDLCASGIGAVCFTFLLRPLGAEILMWIVSGVALAGFIIYALTVKLSKVYVFSVPLLFLLGCIFWGNDLINDHPVYYKHASRLRKWGATLEQSEWTTVAKIDVWSFDETGSKRITMDGDCLTRMPSPLYTKNYFLSEEEESDYWVRCQRIPYFIRPSPDDVLVIGSGGGLEIVMANAWEAKRITGVEINPATYDLVRGPYRDFLKWPKWENVTLYNAEGRHFVENTDTQYDVISMTGVDTFTALSSGAYVLAENYLYTVEAIEDYLHALQQDGVMLILRWFYSKQPRESLRLVNLFMSAAERFGIETPSQCIMVIALHQSAERSWAATLFKREPFTRDEVKTILSRIKEQKGLAPIYIPDVFPPDVQNEIEAEVYSRNPEVMDIPRIAYNRLIRSKTVEERRAFEKEYPFKIDCVFDDRPFFYEFFKMGDLFELKRIRRALTRAELAHYLLYVLFALTLIISVLAMILPLQVFAREGIKVQRLWSLLLFFCSLGMGFMFIELGLMQNLSLYLGHPMHTLSVVLAGILVFTGIGSYRAGTKKSAIISLFRQGMIGTAVASLMWLLIMAVLIPFTLGWPLWLRISLTLLSMLPIGLFMGMPFATGLRYLEEHYPRFIPWAWGINGITSVAGSVLAIILAMRVGFTVVIILGCVIYILGFVAVARHLRDEWRVDY